MQFCVDCHRNPAARLRPREYVFDLAWQASADTPTGEQLMQRYHITTVHLSDCSICHR
jgi:hypothetical protein